MYQRTASAATSHVFVILAARSTADRRLKYRKRKSVRNFKCNAPDSYVLLPAELTLKIKRLFIANTSFLILMLILMSHIRTQNVSTNPGHLHAVQYCKQLQIQGNRKRWTGFETTIT